MDELEEQMKQSMEKLLLIMNFYNTRTKYYHKEINILKEQILLLKKKILIYYEMLDSYREEADNYEKINMLNCKICLNKLSNTIIKPCNHIVCCESCLSNLESDICPVCRTPFTSYYKIFY